MEKFKTMPFVLILKIIYKPNQVNDSAKIKNIQYDNFTAYINLNNARII